MILSKLELTLCIASIIFLNALRRVYSAKKNGAFYAKKNPNCKNSMVKKWVANIHLLESPAWYVQFAGLAVSMYLTLRLLEYGLILSAALAIAISWLTSLTVEYHFQKWINIGSGLPPIDPEENLKSEFTFGYGGRTLSYWWSRPWYGKRRIYVSLGAVMLLIAIILWLILTL